MNLLGGIFSGETKKLFIVMICSIGMHSVILFIGYTVWYTYQRRYANAHFQRDVEMFQPRARAVDGTVPAEQGNFQFGLENGIELSNLNPSPTDPTQSCQLDGDGNIKLGNLNSGGTYPAPGSQLGMQNGIAFGNENPNYTYPAQGFLAGGVGIACCGGPSTFQQYGGMNSDNYPPCQEASIGSHTYGNSYPSYEETSTGTMLYEDTSSNPFPYDESSTGALLYGGIDGNPSSHEESTGFHADGLSTNVAQGGQSHLAESQRQASLQYPAAIFGRDSDMHLGGVAELGRRFAHEVIDESPITEAEREQYRQNTLNILTSAGNQSLAPPPPVIRRM